MSSARRVDDFVDELFSEIAPSSTFFKLKNEI